MATVVYANTTIPRPTYKSGSVELPNTSTLLPSLAAGTGLGLLGLHFFNATAAQVLITITDGANGVLYTDYPVAPGQPWDPEFSLLPVTGLKWKASVAAGVWGRAWGFLE